MSITFPDVALHVGPDGSVGTLDAFRSILSGELYERGRRRSIVSSVDRWSGLGYRVVVVIEGYGGPYSRSLEISPPEMSVLGTVPLKIVETFAA